MGTIRTLLYEIRRIWPLLVIIALGMAIYQDPAPIMVMIYTLSAVSFALIVIHLFRKALYPYIDLSELVREAKKDPKGAAVVFFSVTVLVAVVLFVSVTAAHAGEIPDRAKPLLPVLSASLNENWPEAPLRHIPAGQIEQESAWKEKATLKTSRELGRGLGQLTIAYRSDGSERFNAYRDAVKWKALQAWDWEKDPYNVTYHLTYVVLRDRSEFVFTRSFMVNDEEAWRAALVCYNAGRGRVLKRRAAAKLTEWPADRWECGLEMTPDPGEKRILYGRPLWQAVNEYPHKVFYRALKYRGQI